MTVTAVIPTLGSHPDLLRRAVASLPPDCDLVLSVDLPRGGLAVDDLAGARVLWTGGGSGFAGTAQLGIDAVEREYVLLLNDDAWLEPGAVEVLVDALSSYPARAGAAPKIRFERWPEIINSVGTVLQRHGWADSRGIGQPDVGQYDDPVRVFGLHFAAALIRRSVFRDGEVGPLDLAFGSYYEDIDWCLRANLRGYEFVSAPAAVAGHGHSRTVGLEPLGFQFHLQQRNLLWTVAKSFEAPHAASAIARRTAALARRALRRGDELGAEAGRALREAAAGSRRVLTQRRSVQRDRVVRDAEVFALSSGERSWYDPRTGPTIDAACLIDALRRRSRDEPWVEPLRRAVLDRDGDALASALDAAPPLAATYVRRLSKSA